MCTQEREVRPEQVVHLGSQGVRQGLSEKLVLEYSWMGEDVSHRDSEGRVFQAEGMSVQKSRSNGQLPERLGGHGAGEKVHEPC